MFITYIANIIKIGAIQQGVTISTMFTPALILTHK